MNSLTDSSKVDLVTHLLIITNGLLLSLMVTYFAVKGRFYRPLLPRDIDQAPTLKDLAIVFLVFFALCTAILPLFAQVWTSYQVGNHELFKNLNPNENRVWLQGIALWITVFVMWLTFYWLYPATLRRLYEADSAKNIKNIFYQICFGVMTWFLCFPIVFMLNQALMVLLENFFLLEMPDQVVVKLLKMSFNNRIPLLMYFFGVILAVPILEEFLFRGILQRWLSVKVGPWKGIILASVFFSAMHYANEQGYFNLVLLPCLFLLSCYLGYLYERQRSLWAPIGLHGMFNMVSSLLLLFRSSN